MLDIISQEPGSDGIPVEEDSSAAETRKKRQRIAVACGACRTRKVRCDGVRPVCGVCVRRKSTGLSSNCSYGDAQDGAPLSSRWRSQGSEMQYPKSSVSSSTGQALSSQNLKPACFNVFDLNRGTGTPLRQSLSSANGQRPLDHEKASLNATVSCRDTLSDDRGIDSMTGVIGDETHDFGFFGSSSAGSFMRQIKSAIDAKIGPASRRQSSSGVFRATLSSSSHTKEAPSKSVNYVLPSRRAADDLMSVYWLQVYPLYPFLDPEMFQKMYESVWSGLSVDVDERILMCTLNTVFALSCQLSVTIKPEEREESARSYFKRAQELLQLDLWDVGSTELVQCLLLMGQYLQSTSSPHQCWMIIGHAIRIAQGLGFHLPEYSLAIPLKKERQFSRVIWHGCVLMDRVLSMTFGRPAMISKSLAHAVPLPSTIDASESPLYEPAQEFQLGSQPSRMLFFVESLRLYDIISNILLELYAKAEKISTTDQYGTYQTDHESLDLATILKLDNDLMLWGRSLPPCLRISSLDFAESTTLQRQAIVCRARFLHARILLLRPALSHLCLSENALGISLDESLFHRVVLQCSSLCVRTAHEMIQLIHSILNPDSLTGQLPAWWYCILYIYTAATVLLAARLQPILSVDNPSYSLARSWDHAIQVLKYFERLGPSAQRCVAALEILSAKVPKVDALESNVLLPTQNEARNESGTAHTTNFGEYSEEFDFGGIEIDLSDMSWLNILPGNLG